LRGHLRKAAPAEVAVHCFLAAVRRLRSLALLLLLPSLACAGLAQVGQLPTLTTIGAVHRMSCAEAARAYPVHVFGVITYYDPYLNHPRPPVVMVTDATGSIYVGLPSETTLPLKAGTMLEVTGQSGPGNFAPAIDHAQIRILGQTALPAHPPRKSMTQLLTGSEDAQWVEMEGVVEWFEISGNNVTLKLATSDGEMAATTVREPGADYARLIDAKVRIDGVAGSLFNRRSQIIGIQLLFPGLSTVTVEERAPEKPFQLPVSAIEDLMSYTPGKVVNHRAHIRGIVSLLWPGRLLCVEDTSQSLCAETAQTTDLAQGQVVDVIGFPVVGNVTPRLRNANYQPAPGNQPVSIREIDAKQAIGGEHDAQLVQMEGRLIAHDRASPDPTIVISSGKFTFPVILPKSANAWSFRGLQEGSLLRITGICSVHVGSKVLTRHDGNPVASYFQIMLRSSKDVTVVERPSWWTAEHTLWVLALALVIALGVLCWTVLLRIRLTQQTELLRHQATHDGLTGIWNRKAVLDLMRREVDTAARANKRIGVMMLDADHFKRVNDTHGHLAGDAVLKELAKRIQLTVRSYDLTGRYGGEEFLIVLPGCTADEVQQCAERVRSVIADHPISAEGLELAVTVSVGTAVLDPMVNTQRDALAAADKALYQAKHAGRNRVVFGQLKPHAMMSAAY
jgi:diguanylate cyclase (GGDEF)-like protein